MVADNKCLKKVKIFKYFGYEISREIEKDIQQKLANFAQKILGILNNTFEPTLVPKFSRIKVYNALALPILLYRIEIWSLRKKEKKKIDINQDETFRRTAGHTLLDHQRNEEILE